MDKPQRKQLQIALVGNPNTGKTSLFNKLTGLNQKIGNYPGITVDKKTGFCKVESQGIAEIIDLPGTYSLNPSSMDEMVVHVNLTEANTDIDAVVVVADATNLKRNLFVFTQIRDLGMPTLLVLNMMDVAEKKGLDIDVDKLSEELGVDVVTVSARKNLGIEELKEKIFNISENKNDFVYKNVKEVENLISISDQACVKGNDYQKWLIMGQDEFTVLCGDKLDLVQNYIKENKINLRRLKVQETVRRYQFIDEVLKKTIHQREEGSTSWTQTIDRILTHKVFGLVIFAMVMLLMFQAIYSWAEKPMELIETGFTGISDLIYNYLPEGPLSDLLAEGVVSGLAGVCVFVPQIAILFMFISILEESGYMSRVVFLMDRIMRPFGLSGKSVVPLISGTACAIPAIMSARNIENWKERLITILVTPLTTCSARLPVYTILISLVIPKEDFYGFNMQGLVLMLMYIIGFASAMIFAFVLNKLVAYKVKSHFIVEMPTYKVPMFKNVVVTIWDKTKSFLIEAGQIILAISVILWVLASYGPSETFDKAEEIITEQVNQGTIEKADFESELASYKLENSYIGNFGRAIEPVIQPLGYDWKIGVALLSSLAAREVFVGTIATLYSVGSEDDQPVLLQMKQEVNPITGGPRYTLGVGLSLLIFYAFAMQCIGTIAIVKKETNTWMWPILQFTFLTLLAYISAYITYNIFL